MSTDTSPVRRGRPGHDQAAVLRRAIDLFNSQGYDGTSMGDLASALGVTKSALYHHVPGKDALLAEALDEALAELERLVAETRGETGHTAYERLRYAVRRSVEVLVAHQPAVTLLLRVRGNSPVELAALGRRRAIDTALAALVADAAAEGALRSDLPPAVISRLLFGSVNSLVEWYDPSGTVAPTAIADAVTRMAFDGLRNQGRLPASR
ncbi:MAG: TetR/AcrR family transcriptional regulator [Nostocoides sp.]